MGLVVIEKCIRGILEGRKNILLEIFIFVTN
jgi:hypothetical protein